jgi:hypothetical protein
MHLAGCNVSMNWLLSEETHLNMEGLDYEFGEHVAQRFKGGIEKPPAIQVPRRQCCFGHQEKLEISSPDSRSWWFWGHWWCQQYFREPWDKDDNEHERFSLQEKVRRFPLFDSMVRIASNCSLFVGLHLADKVMLTHGRPGSVFSFFNEDHKDNDDFLFPEDELEWVDELELDSHNEHTSMISSRYQETVKLLGGTCLPTTCLHRHVWDTLDGNVHTEGHGATQFFYYCCLGVVQAVLDGIGTVRPQHRKWDYSLVQTHMCMAGCTSGVPGVLHSPWHKRTCAGWLGYVLSVGRALTGTNAHAQGRLHAQHRSCCMDSGMCPAEHHGVLVQRSIFSKTKCLSATTTNNTNQQHQKWK